MTAPARGWTEWAIRWRDNGSVTMTFRSEEAAVEWLAGCGAEGEVVRREVEVRVTPWVAVRAAGSGVVAP